VWLFCVNESPESKHNAHRLCRFRQGVLVVVNYFDVMGLKRTASDREIRDAYRRLAKQLHPDSNPDPEAARKMQQLNAAKDVLFDPIRREEHRVMLAISERPFSAIPGYRPPGATDWPAASASPRNRADTRPNARRPRSQWDKLWRGWFMAVVALVLLFVTGVIAYEVTRPEQVVRDPISEIIARYRNAPRDAPLIEDTATVPDDTLPQLKRHGDILFSLGEYRSASKFYERYLKKDSGDEEVIKNLSLAYFKRGKYAQSLDVLSRQMHGDSNLIVAYYNIGELFLKEEKPFDARNAFQAALRVGEQMQREGRGSTNGSMDYYIKAKSELAKLE
jgi:tetratricopeptide (TPR) repeat protein